MTAKGIRFATVLAAAFAACLASAELDRFQAFIGIDDGAKGRPGDGIFRVQVDGKEVFRSEVLRPGSPVVKLDIPIAGAKELKLLIDDEGNGHGGDWAEWLDARLVDSKSGEFVFLTDLQPEEKAWIGATRDRSVIRQPMRVNGVTYLRGWGCISGSELLFKDWDKAIKAAEAKVDADLASALKALGKPAFKLSGKPPKGVSLDAKGAKPTIQVDLSDRACVEWLKGKVAVKFGKRRFALIDLIQPTERLLHRGIAPNRIILAGGSAPANVILAGAAWPAKGPVRLELRDLALAASRLSPASAKAGGTLTVKVKPFRTNEVPDASATTSALCKIVADGKAIGFVLSDNAATYEQTIPLDQWPERLECVTTPGADGSLADSFVLDLGLRFEGMKEPLWLHTVDPSFQKFEYGQPDKLIAGESWRIPGLGLVRWLGLQTILKAREAGLAELEAAKEAIAQAKTREEIDAAVAKVVAVDPGQPDVRLLAAARFRELNVPMQERRQLGLLLETSRADLKTVQGARKRIDDIWSALIDAKPPLPAGPSTGEEHGLIKRIDSQLPIGTLSTFNIGPSSNWSRSFELEVENAGEFGVFLNSRGVECTVAVTEDGKQTAAMAARFPFVRFAAKAGGKLTVTVSVDPDATGMLLDHDMDIACRPVAKDARGQEAKWGLEVRPDGSARVSTDAGDPVVAAIPRTATDLRVMGGLYTLREPISEYLVAPDGKLDGNNLVLFAVPLVEREDSSESNFPGFKVDYTWPDAVYNVPMSHFDWDRLNRVYLQTPAALLETGTKTKWTITGFPENWKIHTSTPAPSDKDQLVFEVEPQAGLTVVWNAKDVLTPWIAMKHRNLTMYIPDNPNNRYWFPLWMSYVRQVYDKQVENTGYEKPNYLYVGVQGASMLSGYGGGTAGDDHTSETWLPATGRCSPYFWMHNGNPSGVDSHELHWVAFGCFVDGLPVWVTNGFGGWIEETGWRCTDLAGCEEIMRNHLKNAAAALELIKAGGKNPMQSTQEEWDALPGPTREKMISLGWLISEELYKAYGKDFWAKFWTEQRAKNADAYKKLTGKQKDVFFVDELVRMSKDAKLKERFEKEWGFDLS